MGTGTVQVPVLRIFHFYGGIGTGIGQIWYRKKVSEPVSDKFGTEKRYRYRYRKYLVPEKVSVSVSSNILGTVTHWLEVKAAVGAQRPHTFGGYYLDFSRFRQRGYWHDAVMCDIDGKRPGALPNVSQNITSPFQTFHTYAGFFLFIGVNTFPFPTSSWHSQSPKMIIVVVIWISRVTINVS